MTPDDIGALDPDVHVPINPGAYDPEARLADMDAMGIDARRRVPDAVRRVPAAGREPRTRPPRSRRATTTGSGTSRSKPVAACIPVAILPMHSVLLAQRELERVADKGFTSVVIRPAFFATSVIEGHSIRDQAARAMSDAMREGLGGAEWSDRHFVENTPFRSVWSRIDELGMVACVHPSLGITGPDAISSGAFAERVSQRLGVHHTITEPIAYMQDADLFVTAALFHGLLEDLPEAAARDPALRHELGAAGTREVGDLPLALAAVRDRVRVPGARGGLGAPPARRRRSTAGSGRWRSCPIGSARRRRGDPVIPTTTPRARTRRPPCSRRAGWSRR